MKKQFHAVREAVGRGYLKAGAVVGVAIVSMPSAFALDTATETAVNTAMDQVKTDGVAMVTKGFPLVAAVTGLMIVLTLFKKVIKKGAGG